MPRVEEIRAFLDELAPQALAEDWDNVGALVDCGSNVTSVMMALDITDEVVTEAEMAGCQLIVSHHPVIFHPLRSVSRSDVAFRMVKKSISGICMHTNMDAADGGVNDILAIIFGLPEVKKLDGMGRVGRLRAPTGAAQLAALCREKFGAAVKYVDAGRPVSTLAVVGGSGGDFIPAALAAGADCLLTGEAGHHDALDAKRLGLSLVAAGHFATEVPLMPVLGDKLKRRFPELRVLVSKRCRDPFTYL